MAVVDYFLKIDGIDGESQDAKHPNEIQLEYWSWGESQSGTMKAGGGGGAGKVAMDDFRFGMHVNKASPKLFLACANGEHIKSALLTCRKAGKEQQEYLKMKFTDVLISSLHTSGSGSGDVLPMEEISLNFDKVEYEYREQKPDGTLGGAIKSWWSTKKNQGG